MSQLAAVGEDEDRQTRMAGPQRVDELAGGLLVPIAEDGDAHFRPVGAPQERDGGLAAIGADDRPASARSDGGDPPPLGGVGIDQQ